MPKPVVAAVNGAAAGAGANIALACDIVLAARSAKFLQAFARIGLIPDAGGSWSLPRLVGPARARGLAMLAEPLGAETAADWGLIWKAVDDETLMEEAREMAMKLANGPTLGLALTKQAIQAATVNSLEDQLLLEEQLQARAGASDDYREGVSAFSRNGLQSSAAASPDRPMDFDLTNLPPGFIDDPHPHYAALRVGAPVHELPTGGLFLSRHADLLRVYKDRAVFSSDKKIEFRPKFGDSLLYQHHTTSLVFNDAPLHTRVRRAIAGALSPRAIAGMDSVVRTLSTD